MLHYAMFKVQLRMIKKIKFHKKELKIKIKK